ncbi:MAG: hypothetical protein FWD03_06560 [Defluviitaleaceae bacterium]|nr:hypothetical protein [Defluviitaleaceae bacterium]
MDKNILLNYHRIFVFMRHDIKQEVNRKIVDLLLDSLHKHVKNNDFVVEIRKMMMSMPNTENFNLLERDTDDKAVVDGEAEIRSILLYAVAEIKQLLKNKAYDEAYDIVDAIHALPEIFANDRANHLSEYWKIYIEPVRLKWGQKYFTEVSKYFN